MTVSQLMQKLSTCDPNAHVLVDKNDRAFLGLDCNEMGEAIVVAAGVAYQVFSENSGSDYWVSQYNWHFEPPGVPLTGTSSVYIGSGDAIVTPMWTKK